MKTNRQNILEEIRRLARAAGGVAPGKRAFETATGIRESAWLGKHWVRWNDAVTEAGCTPNQKRVAYSETFLIEQMIRLGWRHIGIAGLLTSVSETSGLS